MLIEALVGILIFSIGILAMVGLQAVSMRNSVEAKYRSDASYLANAIVSQMWTDANLTTYAHKPVDGATPCSPSGGDSANGRVTAWLAAVAQTLPSAVAARQQIVVTQPAVPVDSPVASRNIVTVTVCWMSPQDQTWHNFRTIAYVNR
jgi:type IV pilus assembly protein PilV